MSKSKRCNITDRARQTTYENVVFSYTKTQKSLKSSKHSKNSIDEIVFKICF